MLNDANRSSVILNSMALEILQLLPFGDTVDRF